MRSTVTLLAAVVLCLPTIAAEAQRLPSRSAATAASEAPGMTGGNYPQLAHGEGWEYPGMGWGAPGMGWGGQMGSSRIYGLR